MSAEPKRHSDMLREIAKSARSVPGLGFRLLGAQLDQLTAIADELDSVPTTPPVTGDAIDGLIALAKAENDKVDELLCAIEASEIDVGHRSIKDIIGELGPLQYTLHDALAHHAKSAAPATGDKSDDSGCICKGNWRAIVKESEPLIGRAFASEHHRGGPWRFFGPVHGGDDYYYGFWRGGDGKGELVLASCVGSIKTNGFTLVDEPPAQGDAPVIFHAVPGYWNTCRHCGKAWDAHVLTDKGWRECPAVPAQGRE